MSLRFYFIDDACLNEIIVCSILNTFIMYQKKPTATVPQTLNFNVDLNSKYYQTDLMLVWSMARASVYLALWPQELRSIVKPLKHAALLSISCTAFTLYLDTLKNKLNA